MLKQTNKHTYRNIDLNLENNRGETALHFAIKGTKCPFCILYLILQTQKKCSKPKQ